MASRLGASPLRLLAAKGKGLGLYDPEIVG